MAPCICAHCPQASSAEQGHRAVRLNILGDHAVACSAPRRVTHRVAHPAPAGAGGPSAVSLGLALGPELAVRSHPNSCAMMAPPGSTLSRPAAPTKSALWPRDPRADLAKLKYGMGLS